MQGLPAKKWIDVRTFLCFVDCASLYNLVNIANLVHNFLSMYIYFLYMFQATMCPSSGEITVSMWHFVFVTMWMTVWYASTQSDKYQVSHRYSYFSWWWAHSCPKHVEKRNKHTKKIVHQVGFIYKTYGHLCVTSAEHSVEDEIPCIAVQCPICLL